MRIVITTEQTMAGIIEKQTQTINISPFDTTPKALIDAKGDLLAGTGPGVLDNLPVGTDGQVLIADSGETTGMKWGLPSSGGAISLYNNDATDHAVGTVVIIDTTENYGCKKTTSQGDPKVYAVAIEEVASESSGNYAQTGQLEVLVQGNVARGDWLICSSTSGRAMSSGVIKPTCGGIGIAQTAYSGGSAGSVYALVDIDLGTTAPLQQLSTVTAPAYSNTSSYSFSHTVDPGTDCVVLLVGRKNSTTPSSVTLDGVTMTSHKTSTYSSYVTESVYYLKNPPIGTKTIVATFANSAETTCTVLNFSGTQSTPLRTAVESAGSAGSASLTPSSAVGDIVLFLTTCGETNWTGSSSGMVSIDDHLAGTSYTQRSWYKPGESGTTTVSATGSSAYFTSIGVAVAGS